MKIRCPKHDDQTPSLQVYNNGAFCFAGCGLIPLSDLGLKPGEVTQEEKYVEDLDQVFLKINNLPLGDFRGFKLPHDPQGYYIVWPNHTYYKRRNFSGKPKYKGPAGLSPPIFWVRQGTADTLLVVEGEFDALSAALALPELDVMSPGSTSNFNRKLLTELKPYANIILIADSDPAGIEAVIGLGALIHAELPGATFKRVLKASGGADLNELHTSIGIDAVRQEVIKLCEGLHGEDSRSGAW